MPLEREQIGACTLYRGDCLEVLPTLAPVDAVITDPPYEGLKGSTVRWGNQGLAPRRVQSSTVGGELGTAEGLALVPMIARHGAIVFCSYHCLDTCIARLGGKRIALIVWHKRNSPPSVNNAPHYVTEFAWAVQYAPGLMWRSLPTHIDGTILQAGCLAHERLVASESGKAIHPTQKPIACMRALLIPGMQTVCDPYMGLGTTGITCVETGRAFIGIELEKRYFDIACQRITAAYAQPDLFVPTPVPPRQLLLQGATPC